MTAVWRSFHFVPSQNFIYQLAEDVGHHSFSSLLSLFKYFLTFCGEPGLQWGGAAQGLGAGKMASRQSASLANRKT